MLGPGPGLGLRLSGPTLTKPIYHIQSIASDPGNVGDSAFDVGPGIAGEAVEARVAVGEGGAHPRLCVAHLPAEGLCA